MEITAGNVTGLYRVQVIGREDKSQDAMMRETFVDVKVRPDTEGPRCPGSVWSWGVYDLPAWPPGCGIDATDLVAHIGEMATMGFRGVRWFMNAYFGENNGCGGTGPGIQPYAFNGSSYDLNQWSTTYWNRMQAMIKEMLRRDYLRITFTLSHSYQGPDGWGGDCSSANSRMPWVNNVN